MRSFTFDSILHINNQHQARVKPQMVQMVQTVISRMNSRTVKVWKDVEEEKFVRVGLYRNNPEQRQQHSKHKKKRCRLCSCRQMLRPAKAAGTNGGGMKKKIWQVITWQYSALQSWSTANFTAAQYHQRGSTQRRRSVRHLAAYLPDWDVVAVCIYPFQDW